MAAAFAARTALCGRFGFLETDSLASVSAGVPWLGERYVLGPANNNSSNRHEFNIIRAGDINIFFKAASGGWIEQYYLQGPPPE